MDCLPERDRHCLPSSFEHFAVAFCFVSVAQFTKTYQVRPGCLCGTGPLQCKDKYISNMCRKTVALVTKNKTPFTLSLTHTLLFTRQIPGMPRCSVSVAFAGVLPAEGSPAAVVLHPGLVAYLLAAAHA